MRGMAEQRASGGGLSIVIPVYNEASTIEAIVSRVRAVSIDKEIIIVDDGSTNGTRSVIERLEREDDVRVVRHERNRGKSAALRSGFREAVRDVVIVQDADLEYDPQDYLRLIRPILDDEADVVYGSRFAGGRYPRGMSFWSSVGNRLLTLLSNAVTGLDLTDMETCYKAFRRDVIQWIRIEEKRFGFEPEVTVKLARLPGVRIREVAISYAGRTHREGKKIGWRDGLRAVWCIFKYRYARRS